MSHMRKMLLVGVAAAGMMSFALPADAALSISSVNGGAPTGAVLFNFDDLAPGTGSPQTTTGTGGAQMTVTLTPDARVATLPNVSGQYAAPYLSGNNGAGFGSPNQPNGQDATPYLASGSNGGNNPLAAVALDLPFEALYFGILWGSVDTYNTLSFYNGADLIGTITGTDVNVAANGDQGEQGTFYVNITSTLAFDRVVATSSQYAFEFDNVALSETPIPAPAALAVFGLGLLGLGLARRAKRSDT